MANNDLFLSSQMKFHPTQIHDKTPMDVNWIRIWNHTFIAHPLATELLVLQLPAMGEEIFLFNLVGWVT